MKKMFAAAIFISVGVSTGSFVFAVGSGGGGGSGSFSTCSDDTYTCGEWTDCSLDGTQTRVCTLADDCVYVVEEPPSQSRTCEPVCRSDGWTCEDWEACSSGSQTRTCRLWYDCPLVDDPSPSTIQSCDSSSPTTPEEESEPVPETRSETSWCAEDTWTCSNWAACDRYGNQSRSCALTSDCASAVSDSPATAERCDHLQCDQEALYDRVLCRLNLAPAGVARELEIEYLPEVCRPFDGEERSECIEYYEEFNTCWKYPVGEARFYCAQKFLELPENPTAEHVYYMIAFRFYDLEQRAEAYAEEGVELETTAAFVTKVIENKIAFQEAETYEARRALIQKMRDDWATYILEARKQLGR